MQVQCVLFDCDGTLVDSEMLASRAYHYLFSQFGVDLNIQEVHDQYKGMKIYDILAELACMYGVSQSPSELEPEFRKELHRLMEAELEIIPGVEALVRKINVPIGVVSNGPREKIAQSLKITGLERWFGEHLFSAFDCESWKPDPGLLLKACGVLQVEPNKTILVDDSVSGVKAGIRAGMHVWYFTHTPDIEVEKNSAVTVFNDMKMLPELWHKAGINVFD